MALPKSDWVRDIRRRAEACLHASEIVVLKKATVFEEDGHTFCTWHLCLDQAATTPPKETCAIFCGILISIICGGEQARHRPEVTKAVDLLKQLQEQQGDGGWTSLPPPPGEKEDSLVLDTCYAVRALLEAGEDRLGEALQKAGQWLVGAANPKGGWGFLSFECSPPDHISYVLPTCYAIRALSNIYGPRDIMVRDTIDKALYWLETGCRRSSGAYGHKSEGSSESAVHTAAAIMAFLGAGQSAYSLHIKESVQWLLDNTGERDYLEEEGYTMPVRDRDGGLIGGRIRRRISHVTFPEAFVLQGLVSGEADLLDSRLLELVSALVEAQKDGCWRCPQRPHDERPIYAVMDGCLGLSAFIAQVDEHRDTLDLNASMRSLAANLEDLRGQVDVVSTEVRALKQRTDVLSPLAAIIRSVRKYPLYYLVGALVAGYIIVAWRFPEVPSLTSNIIAAILAAIGLVIQIRLSDPTKRRSS